MQTDSLASSDGTLADLVASRRECPHVARLRHIAVNLPWQDPSSSIDLVRLKEFQDEELTVNIPPPFPYCAI